jgi:hypothetical protein
MSEPLPLPYIATSTGSSLRHFSRCLGGMGPQAAIRDESRWTAMKGLICGFLLLVFRVLCIELMLYLLRLEKDRRATGLRR